MDSVVRYSTLSQKFTQKRPITLVELGQGLVNRQAWMEEAKGGLRSVSARQWLHARLYSKNALKRTGRMEDADMGVVWIPGHHLRSFFATLIHISLLCLTLLWSLWFAHEPKSPHESPLSVHRADAQGSSPPGRCSVNALGPKNYLVPSAPINYGFECPDAPNWIRTLVYTGWLNLQWLLACVYSSQTFYVNASSIRRLGLPFRRNSIRRHDWIYNYWSIMIDTRASVNNRLVMCNVYAEQAIFFKTTTTLFTLLLTEAAYPSLVDWTDVKYGGTVDYTCRRGGAAARKFMLGVEVTLFTVGANRYIRPDDKLVFNSHIVAKEMLDVIANPLKLVANVPLRSLAESLTLRNLKSFTAQVASHRLKDDLANHICIPGKYLGVKNQKRTERRRVLRQDQKSAKLDTAKRSKQVKL
ncbi:hypothetical protein C8R44DRAFT_746318 [Mycena epipterygia]|nr:hypothetical protein C8R44DRAFT_746318 [Mycena epipterygia]